jgi:hypothetical protein
MLSGNDFRALRSRFNGVRARPLQQRRTPASDTDALQASQFRVGSREARAVSFF